MPFQSENQRRFMWWKHPEIARRWANEAKMKARKNRLKKGRYRKEDSAEQE